MIKFKHIFSLKYNPKLIKNMAESTIVGAFAANVVLSTVSAFILYSFLPHNLIYSWLLLHIMIFLGRIFISRKLLYFLKKLNSQKHIQLYFMLSLIITSTTAILYAVMICFIYIYHIPDLYILLMAALIIVMAASSISALGSIIIAFILFVSLSVIPFIIFALLHGGEVFLMLAFILFSYLILHILLGYRQYIMLRNTVFMEETFKSIYEKSSDGIMLIKDRRFQNCNEAMVKMFGYHTKEELLTVNISRFMPKFQPNGKHSVVKMLKMLDIALKNGTNSLEWLHKKRDGKRFWTEIVLTKIMLDGEELIHGVWRDIENRKKLEIAKESANKEIEALNKSLVQRINEEVEKNREKEKYLLRQSRLAQMGEMISMIAHQWRQPLAAISSTSASIELKASLNKLDNDTAQQKAREISAFSQHLSKTIDDFRNFFKPNKGKTETSYDTLIIEVLRIIGISIVNKNIELIQELNCHNRFVTYPNELKQVILNLIKNAEDVVIEKQIDNPYIKISTYTENNKYILEVSDNGEGIPEDIINDIFDPYFSTKNKKNGTGLGLYMSKTIIEEHCGGKIHASNSKNGAVFKIIHENI